MNISISCKNSEVEKWQREFIQDKLAKLKKYTDGPCEAHLVLSVEKFRQIVEINFMADGLNINSTEEAKEMGMAIDNAIEKVEKQLIKQRQKMRERKASEKAILPEKPADLAAEDQFGPASVTRIMESQKVVLKHMTPEDAVLEMQTQGTPFVVYRDTISTRICVLYRLKDGNYSLLETNG